MGLSKEELLQTFCRRATEDEPEPYDQSDEPLPD